MLPGANMLRPWTLGLVLFLIGSALFVWVGASWERSSVVAMTDFNAVYYGSRSLIEHSDPYNHADLERVYLSEAGHSSDRLQIRRAVSLFIYLPTAFILTVPFALLPWGTAHVLWMFATGGSLILAAFLVWSVASTRAPTISGFLICLFLLTSELLLEVGNAAGIAVSLCVIAVWCFIQEKFVPAGILYFAISLLVKPHDAGLIWLYFLLAGSANRKRALQTLLVTAILALPFILWVSYVSPHWMHEMSANLSAHSATGDDSDPGPRGVIAWTHGAQLINLQTVLSVFRDDPRFYNPASYLICGLLLILWIVVVLRSRPTPANAWLALASVAALTMLPTYHRQQDTRLLILIIPAFSLLWAEKGPVQWMALVVTTAGILFTGDISLQLLGLMARNMGASVENFSGKVLMLLLARPATLAILAAGIFFLLMARQGKQTKRNQKNQIVTLAKTG